MCKGISFGAEEGCLIEYCGAGGSEWKWSIVPEEKQDGSLTGTAESVFKLMC